MNDLNEYASFLGLILIIVFFMLGRKAGDMVSGIVSATEKALSRRHEYRMARLASARETARTVRCEHPFRQVTPVRAGGEVVARLCRACGTQLTADGDDAGEGS